MSLSTTLTPLASLANAPTAINQINNNFTAVNTALANGLALNGQTPNQMQSSLDMNSNSIINLPTPSTSTSPVRLMDITTGTLAGVVPALTGTAGHFVPFLDGNNTWSGTNAFTAAITSTANNSWSGTNTFTNSGTALQLTSNSPNINFTDNVTPANFNLILTGGIFQLRNSNATPAYFQVDSTLHNRITLQNPASAINDFATVFISRTANHIGGTSGFVNSALNIQTTVSAGDRNFEWGLLSLLNNNSVVADGSQNVAIYGKISRVSGGSSSWAGVFELDDFTSGGNPVAGSSASVVEIDMSAQGGDTNKQRSLLDLVLGVGAVGGAAPTSTRAIRISAAGSQVANATYTQGLVFDGATYGTLIGSENIPSAGNGIDFTGINFTGSFVFKGGGITLGATGQIAGALLTINGASSGSVSLSTNSASTGQLQFISAGSFSANGAVATALSSVGPTGSHTTVQTWLTIIDNTGALRYIPCF